MLSIIGESDSFASWCKQNSWVWWIVGIVAAVLVVAGVCSVCASFASLAVRRSAKRSDSDRSFQLTLSVASHMNQNVSRVYGPYYPDQQNAVS